MGIDNRFSGVKNNPNYGRTLGSGFSAPSMPSYHPAPQPQSYSQRTTQHQVSPDPRPDMYNGQRGAAMMEAARRADPFAAHRTGWLAKLNAMTTGGAGSFTPDDPSYQHRFKSGQQALESSLAARGLLGSGSAGLELQKYGQKAGAEEFQAQYQRLQSLAGLGDPVAAARLEQDAVESRYRTYQPNLHEIASGAAEYGFDVGGYGGSGGGGAGSGSRSGGGSRSGTSAIANFLNQAQNQLPRRWGASSRPYDSRLLAAKAQDMYDTGHDTFQINQLTPSGRSGGGEAPALGLKRAGANIAKGGRGYTAPFSEGNSPSATFNKARRMPAYKPNYSN